MSHDMFNMTNISESNNNQKKQETHPLILHGCDDTWTFSKRDRSQEVYLSNNNRTAHFHPNWSKGTAGIRGTRILNNGRYFWELKVSRRVFGTSMMFGIGTKAARLHVNSFTNLLGEDKNGEIIMIMLLFSCLYQKYGLSHKGLLWNNGTCRQYTNRFKENEATKIGILFDGIAGTLTYYKDDVCLGVAFRGLNEISEPLYPIVCSTAAKTEMVLCNTKRDFANLQDRCRAAIMKLVRTRDRLEMLKLPSRITEYLAESICETPDTILNNYPNYYDCYMV